MRVLTVGDGDLSYSLALQRAFGETIQLTATVLPTADELAATYSSAAANAAWNLHQAFKFEFVTPQPNQLEISTEQIQNWINEQSRVGQQRVAQ